MITFLTLYLAALVVFAMCATAVAIVSIVIKERRDARRHRMGSAA